MLFQHPGLLASTSDAFTTVDGPEMTASSRTESDEMLGLLRPGKIDILSGILTAVCGLHIKEF